LSSSWKNIVRGREMRKRLILSIFIAISIVALIITTFYWRELNIPGREIWKYLPKYISPICPYEEYYPYILMLLIILVVFAIKKIDLF